MQFFCFHWILFDIACLIFGWQISEKGRVFGDFFADEPNIIEFWTLLALSMVVLPLYSYFIKRLKDRGFMLAQYL